MTEPTLSILEEEWAERVVASAKKKHDLDWTFDGVDTITAGKVKIRIESDSYRARYVRVFFSAAGLDRPIEYTYSIRDNNVLGRYQTGILTFVQRADQAEDEAALDREFRHELDQLAAECGLVRAERDYIAVKHASEKDKYGDPIIIIQVFRNKLGWGIRTSGQGLIRTPYRNIAKAVLLTAQELLNGLTSKS